MKLLLAAAAALALLSRAADAPAPTLRQAGDIDFHASGSLPPGAEYHLMYEDPATHAVQTLVRMPKGYGLPAHSHSHDELIYMVKGKLTLGIDGKETTLSSGGYAVLPAGVVFTMKVTSFGGAEFVASFNGPFDVKLAAPAAKP